jgi:hypothetical protein
MIDAGASSSFIYKDMTGKLGEVDKTATNMTAYKTISQHREQYIQGTPIMPGNTIQRCDKTTVHVTEQLLFL